MRSLAASLVALALLAGLAAAPVGRAAEVADAEARRVHDIAAQLRCVVCQALSVADSPSTTAQQMRALVLEQVRAGKSDEEILAYFVSRYGEWVLLAPPRRGFNLIAWWLPFVGIGLGMLAVVLAARRWVRNGRAARASPAGSGAAGPSGAPEEPGERPGSDAARHRLADELARLRR